jgi:hypothetical protein
VVGVFLGLFPPLIDALLLGPGVGHYAYFQAPAHEWRWTLFDARFASVGEGITLWTTIAFATLYAWVRTGSLARAAAALAGGYGVVMVLAIVPTGAVDAIYPWFRRGFGGTGALRGATLVVIQLLIAQLAYVAARPRLGVRLLERLPHVLPFAMLVWLGNEVRRSEDRMANLLLSHPGVLTAAIVAIVQVALVNSVQNDALEAVPGDARATVDQNDAHFFTVVGALQALAFLVAFDRFGLLIALCLVGSIVYNSPRYAAKRRFPANHKLEGLWAACAFCLGGLAHPELTATPQAMFLRVAFLIFGGFSVFCALKDYKDIRIDTKQRTQTIYTLALRRGVSLRSVHRVLLGLLALGLALFVAVLAPTLRNAASILLAILASVGLFSSALGPPQRATVTRFLLALGAYIGVLAYGVHLGRS